MSGTSGNGECGFIKFPTAPTNSYIYTCNTSSKSFPGYRRRRRERERERESARAAAREDGKMVEWKKGGRTRGS
jgi:hypothetical protein